MVLRRRKIDPSVLDRIGALAKQLDVGANLLAEVLHDQSDRADIALRMSNAETEADQIARALVYHANTSSKLAMDRSDLYDLATELDSVMDLMDEAADMIWLYEVAELPKEFAKQVAILQRCSELTLDALPRLDERGGLAEYWMEVARLESAGDKQFRRILAKLFDGRYRSLEVIKLKDIITAMEAAIDGFKDVAKTVELIVVKRS